jgi:hypothetical protein
MINENIIYGPNLKIGEDISVCVTNVAEQTWQITFQLFLILHFVFIINWFFSVKVNEIDLYLRQTVHPAIVPPYYDNFLSNPSRG